MTSLLYNLGLIVAYPCRHAVWSPWQCTLDLRWLQLRLWLQDVIVNKLHYAKAAKSHFQTETEIIRTVIQIQRLWQVKFRFGWSSTAPLYPGMSRFVSSFLFVCLFSETCVNQISSTSLDLGVIWPCKCVCVCGVCVIPALIMLRNVLARSCISTHANLQNPHQECRLELYNLTDTCKKSQMD